MWVLVNVNSLLGLPLGKASDARAMKARVKGGYDGEFSPHVERYDELGLRLQERAADAQLQRLGLAGQSVLDVGCGTGVLALMALRAGARWAVCGDISALMIEQARTKEPPSPGSYSFSILDGENLPFQDGSFDAVVSGMAFGLFPNQKTALREMVRVTRPGGLVCVGAHGPEHYWEAIDGCFRCIGKRRILGYRIEFWPRDLAYMRRVAAAVGLEDIQSHRETWRTQFESGGAMYDFFAAISASWWYSMFPADEALRDSERTRAIFERKRMTTITDDVVVVWGRKPH